MLQLHQLFLLTGVLLPLLHGLPTIDQRLQTPCELNDPSALELDIYLLVDVSNGTLTDYHFSLLKNYLVQKLFVRFNIGQELSQTRLALIPYSDTATPLCHLNMARSTSDILFYMSYLKQQCSKTVDLAEALNQLSSADYGNRPSIPDVVLLFISQPSSTDPTKIARQLKSEAHTGIITVSMSYKAPDMSNIASTSADAFVVRNMAALDLTYNGIIQSLCRMQGTREL